jgi:hypothetical protein
VFPEDAAGRAASGSIAGCASAAASPPARCVPSRGREEWIEIAVPALITPTQCALAQERFAQNRRFAARHTKRPSLLQAC